MLCLHELPGGSNPAARNADVDVGMEGQLLAPCMEDRDDPGLRSKELRVGAQGEQRLLHTFKLQIQEDLQIRLDQRPEIMRDSEYDMKVGNPFDQFRVALQLPLLFQGCLAAGTGAVVAGDSVDQGEPAVFTEAYVVTEATGLAAHDGGSHSAFFFQQFRMTLQVRRVKALKSVTDGIISRSHKDSSRSFRCRCRVPDRVPWKKGIYGP